MKFSGYKNLAGTLTCILLLMTGLPSFLAAKGIKTSYKHYFIFTHQNQDILCEPYIVKKNDWLYKILKQKGEIAEHDFPLFISIFKQLNPHIHNIDAISAGARILIPLKMVDKEEFTPDDTGMVEVPVVEFHDIKEPFNLAPHIRNHTIAPGEVISALMDEPFLKQGGGITREGRILFYHLNPDIKNIHLIHPGDRVKIPEPSILKQPWFRSFLTSDRTALSERQIRQQTVSHYQIQQLQQYAAAINGKLIHQGKMVFPGRDGRKDGHLDLSKIPLIETDKQGEKILIIPDYSGAGHVLDRQLLQNITSYWQQLKIEPFDKVINKLKNIGTVPPPPTIHSLKKTVSELLSKTEFEYFPEEKIRFSVNHIPVSATLNRVKRPDQPDLLLNFGNIYGQGITAIRDMGLEVLSFPLGQPLEDQIQHLLSALGYNIWENPAFNHHGTVETLTGIYAEQSESRLFISRNPLPSSGRKFLDAEQIRYLHLKP
ncbi:MAG: hypothetical protein K9K40_00170 [Desulfotignum sp.]|nr:hypothetical protein [Desulfotignum sp.]MCF8124840.1 hypothetical protein [Desulfotignum sp.]